MRSCRSNAVGPTRRRYGRRRSDIRAGFCPSIDARGQWYARGAHAYNESDETLDHIEELATQLVTDHLEALRAAFGLTSEEIALIVDQVVLDANAAAPPPNPFVSD
jgi:hypothetical protein